MPRALLALLLLTAEPADACSPPLCEFSLQPLAPARDAGNVPTNAQLLAWVPSVVAGAPERFRLGRLDGGDGDGGVPLTATPVTSVECSQLIRFRPAHELMALTDYALTLDVPDAGAPFGQPVTAEPILFRTAAGADLSSPLPPTLADRRYHEASCSSCGTSGGGASVSFKEGDAVWFAPAEAKYGTHGGRRAFFVEFSCGIVSGLGEGVHQMPVIAFDSAWNVSDISYVELETNCTGLDPCTGGRVSDNPGSAPLRGASGCGCTVGSTLLPLLSAAALARVLSRRRRWSSSSTSGCWRWGRSASSSSPSRR